MKSLTTKDSNLFPNLKKGAFIKSNKGSALFIVLVFSIIAFITISAYVSSQFFFARTLRKEPAKLQALLNARSGIWYALAMLDKEVGKQEGSVDSSDTSMSDIFGMDMFDRRELDGEEPSSVEETTAMLEEQSDTISLCDSTIQFTYLIKPSAFFQVLESEGVCRKYHKQASVTLGAKPFSSPDTVLFLSTPGLPEGTGNCDGKVAFITESIDSSDSLQRKRFFVNKEKLRGIVEEFRGPLMSMGDTMVRNEPLTVQHNDEFSDIPDTVSSPLFIDGSSRDLSWRAERTIYVIEELQITGSVYLEGMTFIVGGDVKILDEARLKSVEIFSAARIFFAGESLFNGNAMACADIEIYEEATIAGKSIIISTGLSKSGQKAGRADPLEEAAPLEEMGPGEEAVPKHKVSSKKKKKIKPYSAYIRDQASFDGVLIDLRRLGGISTDEETVIQGVLWAEGRICHKGRMRGIITSAVLVDESEPMKVVSNSLAGSIQVLNEIGEYFLPYFMGQPVIKEWKEK